MKKIFRAGDVVRRLRGDVRYFVLSHEPNLPGVLLSKKEDFSGSQQRFSAEDIVLLERYAEPGDMIEMPPTCRATFRAFGIDTFTRDRVWRAVDKPVWAWNKWTLHGLCLDALRHADGTKIRIPSPPVTEATADGPIEDPPRTLGMRETAPDQVMQSVAKWTDLLGAKDTEIRELKIENSDLRREVEKLKRKK